MINVIWFLLVFIGIIYSFFGSNNISDVILNSGNASFDLIVSLAPNIVLWSGILNIARNAGILEKISKLLKPFLKRIMPSCKNDKVLEYISSNVAANMLGLGSVATPAGLKAMKELDIDNNHSNVASDSMITFLVLNTSGVTLIPMTVLSLRVMYHSVNPTCIIVPGIIATICSTVAGLTLDYFIRRRHE